MSGKPPGPADPVDARLSEIIASVGADVFQRACVYAWATAAGTGIGMGRERVASDKVAAELPHDLVDLTILNEELPWPERVRLHFALYRRMPSYALLMYCWPHDMPDDVRAMFWQDLRDLLEEHDPRLADPVSYWLWCGPFESPDDVDEAWSQVAVEGAPGRARLERVLGASGPVPWSIKAGLIESLASDATWHETIRVAVSAAKQNIHRDVDAQHASQILRRVKAG